MAKTLINEHDLLEWLNTQLAGSDGCDGCRFTSVQRHEPDSDGCNWSPHNLQCSGVPSDVCLPAANQAAAMARQKFNLK